MASTDQNPHPVAILIGIETQIGLTIIRELGQRGVRVLGIASEPHALGLYSRYLWKAVRRTSSDQEFVGQLKRLAAEHKPSVVMAIAENDINLLNLHRDEFADVALLIPEPAKMAVVLDKARTRQLAQSIGIPVPRVWPVASMRDFDALRQHVTFPVVLKWGDPLSVAPTIEAAGLPLDKFKYCQDWTELSRYLGQFAALRVFPIVQEYCPGYGLGQSVFMHAGKPLLIFQHRRIHEWPPEGGFSTLCEGLYASEHEELQRKTVALLQAIGWEGAAMVEYRYDPASRQAWLMEINGRFWGSLPLASYSGAEFGWLTYSVLGLKTVAEQPRVRAGLRCRALVTEAKRLVRIVFFPEKIQDKRLRFSKRRECVDFIADCLRPSTKYFVYSWTDPKPAIYDLILAVWRRLRAGAAQDD